ncbi:MAG: KH domain-containing protein [Ilumatobacteraceae bacterium]
MVLPDDTVRDLRRRSGWPSWCEQLLAVTTTSCRTRSPRVTEWEWPRIRCEIVVERESQKGMVIGKKGAVLKEVGIRVRRQLPDGVYLELHVKVDKDWQRRPDRVERLGY